MAFCPNCGTPNTDQAEKCVSCAFELSPKHKAKFKGTIMMSGVQAPTAPGQPAAAPPAAAPPQPAAPAVFTPASHAPVQAPPTGPRNLAFEKTMMGVPPGAGMPQAPAQPAQPSAADLGRAATVEQQAPNFQQPPAAQFQPPAQPYQPPAQPAASSFSQPAAPAAGGFSSGAQSGSGQAAGGFSSGAQSGSGQAAGFGGGGGGGFSSDSEVPAPPKSNTGKMIAIGCGVLFVLACVITGVVVMVKGKQFFSSVSDKIESEGATLEWRTRVAQSLENVLEICKTDCKGAAVYFHPQLQTQLMAEAKGLSQNGLVKLIDPTQSDARMLDGTDDAALATKLNLDPQQCVRITSGSAKVVGCSVPDPAGNSSLRIVHLEGVASL